MVRGLGHVTLKFLAYPLKYLQKRVELETSNTGAEWQYLKTSKGNLEKGRGLGHVTLRMFVIPSDVSPKAVNISANHCLKFCKLP